jgi:CTP synthase
MILLGGLKLAKKPTKFIFVTGGVLSGLGKGIMAASIGHILKSRGLSVNIQKCDPYLNFDAGTLNPGEHGECFVTDDGAETDLDLGHYERFMDQSLTQGSSLMSGRVYSSVFEAERKGEYLGKTVQVVPHITNKIQEFILKAGKGFDIHLVEIGGTIGDYEALHFLEAIRQMHRKVGPENVLYVHLVFLPFLETSKELKTKPAQASIRDLLALGIRPDVIGCRSDKPIEQEHLAKIALFADVDEEAVVALPTIKTVYEVPVNLEKVKLGDYLTKKLGLGKRAAHNGWDKLLKKIEAIDESGPEVKIGIVGKYLQNEDTYKSVTEALKAAGWENGVHVSWDWVNSEMLESKGTKPLEKYDGILIPGGFGNRGTEGKILAAKYARENNIPYLGLCLGMQIATIEYARNMAGITGATSEEFNPKAKNLVIHTMKDQIKRLKDSEMGGTMRLGAYPCELKTGSLAKKLYGKTKVSERHRHRYEFNNAYKAKLEKAGLVCSGVSPDGNLVEMVELPAHKFFIASQFHPEFKSRPDKAHPLFAGFIKAALSK